MYNLVLSKALIGMQSLHTLQHVLYVKPCIGPEHVLAAQAFVPQAASKYVMMKMSPSGHHRGITHSSQQQLSSACSLYASFLYHRSLCYPCLFQTLQMTSTWQGCIKSLDTMKTVNWRQIGVYTSILICSGAAGRLHGFLYGWSLNSSNVSERQDRLWGSMLWPAI